MSRLLAIPAAAILAASAWAVTPRPAVTRPYNVEVGIGRKAYVTHCEHGIRYRKEYTFTGCTKFKVYS
jgi:hypothetical protein